MSDTPRTDQQREMATGMNYMTNFASELERELAAAIKQRDEARELYCRQIAYDLFRTTGVFDPQKIAVKRGWDCFKEGGGA